MGVFSSASPGQGEQGTQAQMLAALLQGPEHRLKFAPCLTCSPWSHPDFQEIGICKFIKITYSTQVFSGTHCTNVSSLFFIDHNPLNGRPSGPKLLRGQNHSAWSALTHCYRHLKQVSTLGQWHKQTQWQPVNPACFSPSWPAQNTQVGCQRKTPGSKRTAWPAEPSLEFISTVNIACK